MALVRGHKFEREPQRTIGVKFGLILHKCLRVEYVNGSSLRHKDEPTSHHK